ncbi:response regulator transcription factor [Wolbachia endosymbiont of Cimex lectularius]|uniref:response regulator transcription factor n=1 Tax=Wolbachia endosymbiont of Cimex lectularius TaxID=246273 RepID=UPI00049A2BFD|nr:response regulator transcription factor [Wolbachia endosymbiont of Cimex lectularius]BAO99358.1 response regulator [Wolbachia endosymbiont of Cimex lectularius]
MRILLIEDDQVSAKTVVNALTSDGHFCDVVTSAQDYNNNIVSSNGDHYDLVILDIHLPGDIDGYDILLRLRSAKIKVPVLILSCISAVNQKAKGLGYGADDYLTKPFHKSELLARIKAIIRRTKGHPESVIKIGNININFDHRIVEVKGKTVHLTNKEYSMIELLALRKGTVLTKEMFLNHLYNGLDEPSDNKIVDVFMCKLRKKLESANDGKSHIETIWGRGYVLKEYVDEEEYSNANVGENSGGYQAEQVKDNA